MHHGTASPYWKQGQNKNHTQPKTATLHVKKKHVGPKYNLRGTTRAAVETGAQNKFETSRIHKTNMWQAETIICANVCMYVCMSACMYFRFYARVRMHACMHVTRTANNNNANYTPQTTGTTTSTTTSANTLITNRNRKPQAIITTTSTDQNQTATITITLITSHDNGSHLPKSQMNTILARFMKTHIITQWLLWLQVGSLGFRWSIDPVTIMNKTMCASKKHRDWCVMLQLEGSILTAHLDNYGGQSYSISIWMSIWLQWCYQCTWWEPEEKLYPSHLGEAVVCISMNLNDFKWCNQSIHGFQRIVMED